MSIAVRLETNAHPDFGCLLIGVMTGQRYPFQTYLPQGQETVSAGCFFSKGLRQTGQFFCHIVTPDYSIGTGLQQLEIGASYPCRTCQISGLPLYQGPWG
jgi:hypothetical protein